MTEGFFITKKPAIRHRFRTLNIGRTNAKSSLRFALAYSPFEFRDTLHMIAEGKIDCAPIVTGTVGLDGVDNAFTSLKDPEKHAKILIDLSCTATAPVSVA